MTHSNLQPLAVRAVDEQHAWQGKKELSDLLNVIFWRSSIFHRPYENVLEIGLGLAGTAWLWRELFGNSAYIVGVDVLAELPCQPCEHRLAHVDCPRVRASQALSVRVVGDSIEPSTQAKIALATPAGGFDLLHIDGAHDYEHVSKDYLLNFERVRMGGLIVFHDIEDYTDVTRFWRETCKKFPDSTTPLHSDGQGIGVLRV